MASRDLMHNIDLKPLFAPKAAVTDNSPQVSSIVDTAGAESVTLALITGTNADTDATFTVLMEDGDDAALADAAAVDDKFLLGTEALAGFTFADDGKCRKIGYVGPKRYVRMTVTPANNTGTLFLGGIAVLGHLLHAPSANPPV